MEAGVLNKFASNLKILIIGYGLDALITAHGLLNKKVVVPSNLTICKHRLMTKEMPFPYIELKTGLLALEPLGLQKITQYLHPINYLSHTKSNGKVLGKTDLRSRASKYNLNQPYYWSAAHRKPIVDLLAQSLPFGIYKQDREFVRIRPRPEAQKVDVAYSNGLVEEYDFVIACDGTFTTMRRFVSDYDDVFTRSSFIGLGSWAGISKPKESIKEMLKEEKLVSFGKNELFVAHPVTKDDIYFSFTTDCYKPDSSNPYIVPTDGALTRPKEYLKDLIGDDFAEPFPSLLSHIQTLVHLPIYTSPTLPTWHANNIILLGHAAQTLSPTHEDRINVTLVDVLTLTSRLLSHMSLAAKHNSKLNLSIPLQEYSDMRRQHCHTIALTDDKMRNVEVTKNPVKAMLRNLTLRTAHSSNSIADEHMKQWIKVETFVKQLLAAENGGPPPFLD